MGQEEIGQSVPVVPLAGVDGDAPRLVQNHQILVLIDDGQRAGNGGNLLAAGSIPHIHCKDLALPGHRVGKDGGPIHQDAPRQRLGPAHPSGGEPQLPPEEGGHGFSRLVCPDGQGEPTHGWASSLSLVFLGNLWYTGTNKHRPPGEAAPTQILWFFLCALLGGAAGEGGAFPVLWYNLGGVIVNALTALVFLPLTLIPNGRQSSKYHSTKPPGPTPTPERSPWPGNA